MRLYIDFFCRIYYLSCFRGVWEGRRRAIFLSGYQKLAATVDSENLPKEIERLERESEDFSDKELYTDSFQAEYALYDEMLRQMRHAAGYAEYADGMVENAQKGEISLFQENNYTRREQEKTVRDFGRLRTYPVTFAPYRGVYLLAGFDFGDIVILVILVLLVASLVTMEKENWTLPLLHSTFHGRRRVGAAKFLGGLSLLLSGIVFLFACKSLIILATYGTGDWNGRYSLFIRTVSAGMGFVSGNFWFCLQ